MTMYLFIQEQQLILGVLGSVKGLGWRPALPMALASKPQKDVWKWRWHLKSMMLLTAHQLGALRYGELSFITHGASFWRILGAKKVSGEKWSEELFSIVQDNGTAVCKNIHSSLCVSPFCCFLPLATNIQRSSFIAWFLTAIFELKLEPLTAWQHSLSFCSGPGLCYWLYVQDVCLGMWCVVTGSDLCLVFWVVFTAQTMRSIWKAGGNWWRWPVTWPSDHHSDPHWYEASFQGRREHESSSAFP